ncbi:MAG: cellulase family glycosylhydrolase [Oceanococcus sp.]
MRTSLLVCLLMTVFVSACNDTASDASIAPAASSVSPTLPIKQSNGWITDADGRVFIVHGFNMVAKDAPYTLESVGFDEDDGAFLAKHGFNAVRLGFMWKASEPEPGQFDENYLSSIERTIHALGKSGVMSLLDFHQDAYNEAVEGQGFPDWMVFDDGIPWVPGVLKEAQPVYQRVWDNFWANIEGANGTPLWDHFAVFWQHVAQRFRDDPNILGYDLMNEPWPGIQTPACLNPVYCPHNATMSAFYAHVMPKIRSEDPDTPFYYEGSLLAGGGFAIDIDVSEPNAVLSFHNYCALTVVGAPTIPTATEMSCAELEALTFDNSMAQANNMGHPAVLTEFGSVPDYVAVSRVAEQADAYRVGWMHWTYFNTGTTNFPGTPSLVLDPTLPPVGDNINVELLETLARPYPKLIAGTPLAWSFDPASKRFELSYSAARVDDGGRFSDAAETVVFIPEVQYPQGYTVSVEGGVLQSSSNATHIVITAVAGAEQIILSVEPNPTTP